MRQSNFINIKVHGKRVRRFIGTAKDINDSFANPHKTKDYMSSKMPFIINPYREKSVNTKVIGKTKIYNLSNMKG
tara:strand:- start:219 stop:443 length:225 start_codon:yes stop_codon:yes gene_type:complete